jgi:hypothetical protein
MHLSVADVVLVPILLALLQNLPQLPHLAPQLRGGGGEGEDAVAHLFDQLL